MSTCLTSQRRTHVHCESVCALSFQCFPTHRCTSLSVCVCGFYILSAVLSDQHPVLFSRRYLINFLLDATLGMLVIYGGVKAVSAVVEWRQWDSLRFGEYGMSLNIKF